MARAEHGHEADHEVAEIVALPVEELEARVVEGKLHGKRREALGELKREGVVGKARGEAALLVEVGDHAVAVLVVVHALALCELLLARDLEAIEVAGHIDGACQDGVEVGHHTLWVRELLVEHVSVAHKGRGHREDLLARVLGEGVDALVARGEHVLEGLVPEGLAELGALLDVVLVKLALVHNGTLNGEEERTLRLGRLEGLDVGVDPGLVELEAAPDEDVLAQLAHPTDDGQELHGALGEEGHAHRVLHVATPEGKQPVHSRCVVAHDDGHQRIRTQRLLRLPLLGIHVDTQAGKRGREKETRHHTVQHACGDVAVPLQLHQAQRHGE
mmetsp:Transcript_24089/g.65159  ORF Transcript_24089/g.65159 Transcript_24089/m.65159 type:complete len:330 (-) Transcript_24089:205-1194(-)